MKIRERLKMLRTALNMTQEDMGAAMGIHQALYGKRELGHCDLSTTELALLRRKYNVNLNWLITGDGEMFEGPLSDINKKLDRLIKMKGH